MSAVLVCTPLLPSTQVLTGTNADGLSRTTQPTPSAGTGIITGIVIDQRQEPIPRAQVQAFSVPTSVSQVQPGEIVPFSMRASGAASTDAAGRFQISGLERGEYLVAAEAVPSLTSGASRQTPPYATTFYPSTIDYQAALRVSAMPYETSPIRIEMVRVKGARVAGSVLSRVSPSYSI
jgi:hypothetical protein